MAKTAGDGVDPVGACGVAPHSFMSGAPCHVQCRSGQKEERNHFSGRSPSLASEDDDLAELMHFLLAEGEQPSTVPSSGGGSSDFSHSGAGARPSHVF